MTTHLPDDRNLGFQYFSFFPRPEIFFLNENFPIKRKKKVTLEPCFYKTIYGSSKSCTQYELALEATGLNPVIYSNIRNLVLLGCCGTRL